MQQKAQILPLLWFLWKAENSTNQQETHVQRDVLRDSEQSWKWLVVVWVFFFFF